MSNEDFSSMLREIGRQSTVDAGIVPTGEMIDFNRSTTPVSSPYRQYEKDKETMSLSEFAFKYGAAAAKERVESKLYGRGDVYTRTAQKQAVRTGGEVAGDIAAQTTSGLVTGTTGLVNLGVLAVGAGINNSPAALLGRAAGAEIPEKIFDTRDLRKNIANFGRAVSEAVLENESATQKGLSEVAQYDRDIRQADSKYAYEQTDKDFGNQAAKVFTDVIGEVATLAENPGVKRQNHSRSCWFFDSVSYWFWWCVLYWRKGSCKDRS